MLILSDSARVSGPVFCLILECLRIKILDEFTQFLVFHRDRRLIGMVKNKVNWRKKMLDPDLGQCVRKQFSGMH